MNRRQFVTRSIVSGLALGAVNSQASTKNSDQALSNNELMIDVEAFTVSDVIQFLHSLPLERLVTAGKWNLSQIFNHAAQSIEFSIMGYPINKSEIFRRSIGPLAFQGFALWGKMTHGLAEDIPGAPALALDDDSAGLQRLIQALSHFDQFKGQLQPHFAYGELSKEDYALAHVLHLNNHLEEVSFVQTA